MKPETEQVITDAIEAINASGERPSVRKVRDYILKKCKQAPSFTAIQPVLKRWRDRQHTSGQVIKLLDAFNGLDVEQQAGFLRLAGLTHKPAHELLDDIDEAYSTASEAKRERLRAVLEGE